MRVFTLQVSAVVERADAMKAVEFLNKRGGNVKWCATAEPPSEQDWHKEGTSFISILKHFLRQHARPWGR